MSQKVIGLIGGMSWESSAEYYRIINQTVRTRLGGLRSARCLMWSFDFGEIEGLQHAGRWDDAATEMITAARRLECGGADFVVICTNTMHPAWPIRFRPRSACRCSRIGTGWKCLCLVVTMAPWCTG